MLIIGVDYRCVLQVFLKNEAVNLMKYSKLDDRGTFKSNII